MGKRIHYTREYKVHWGGGDFNWKADELFDFLTSEDGMHICLSGEEGNAYCDWEIDKDVLRGFIAKQQKLPMDEKVIQSDDDDEDDAYTREEVLEVLNDWLDKSDKDLDYIKLSWF